MRLATFLDGQRPRVGAVDGDSIVDLTTAGLGADMTALIEAGPEALARAAEIVGGGDGRSTLAEVEILSPIAQPPKILAVGLNYADHVAETGRDAPIVPMIFNKQSTSICNPGDPIHVPRASHMVDWEGELGVVIGKRCRHVPAEKAAGVIFGYTIVNDVSVRDWQHRVPTFTMGKSWDTHCPLGPVIVTADEIGNPHRLELKTWVNDDLRQSSNTKHLIFDCYTLVEHLSTAFTLEPGDVISTGTPSGVGAAMDPQVWLVNGDTVRIEIQDIGTLSNPVIDEPEDTPLF
ncbi:MAG: fumarylacetoacetate hydrolase family protein [Acidobacteriota bacterium]|nr:fumarylacetoacetate hydrolase family protein [Acidobacteriota bacterium]